MKYSAVCCAMAMAALLASSAYAHGGGGMGGHPGGGRFFPGGEIDQDLDMPPYAAPLNDADKSYLEAAAHSDQMAIDTGHMALSRSIDPRVKGFGSNLESSTRESLKQLQSIAAGVGIALPTGLDTDQENNITDLSGFVQGVFDSQFRKQVLSDQEAAIELAIAEVNHGSNDTVKAFAQQSLEPLESNVDSADGLPNPDPQGPPPQSED